ncbi:hypothetical protein GCM10009861_23660 [Neomicrococcus aestuarii]
MVPVAFEDPAVLDEPAALEDPSVLELVVPLGFSPVCEPPLLKPSGLNAQMIPMTAATATAAIQTAGLVYHACL